jgi:hypothetical protein
MNAHSPSEDITIESLAQSDTEGGEVSGFQTEQIEELKTASLLIGISIFSFLALLVVAVVLITRWWMS